MKKIVFGLGVLLLFATTAFGQTATVLVVDDLGLSEDSILFDQYPEVRFSAPEGNIVIRSATFPIFPDGPQGFFNDLLVDGLPFRGPIVVDFSDEATTAGAFVNFGFAGDLVVEAFDGPSGSGTLLDTSSRQTNGFLGVGAQGIQSVVFSQGDIGNPTFLLDNFTFTNTAVPEPSFLLGDVNLDGIVNFSDIPGFIAILQSGQFQGEADVDQSGEVDFSDIPAFIEILASQ